jgi:hypothetical protein
LAALAAAFTTLDEPWIAQVPKAVLDRIRTDARGNLVHERFVRKRVLEARGRSEGAVKNGERTACVSTRSLPTVPVPPQTGPNTLARRTARHCCRS